MRLSVSHVSKRFPGVQALNDVSIDIQSGSCHALMGENGAGKSTLGKIFAGLYAPDEGQVLVDGVSRLLKGPQDAVGLGIAMVHQELLFAENLTVAENLCLGNLPAKGLWLDRKTMRAQAALWLAAIGSDISPDTRVADLSISRQQLVQIAGGMGLGAKALIFDEPTSSLARKETERLLQLIRDLKSQGVTCVFVSHRHDEVFAICDNVSVLRDGKHVGTEPAAGLSRDGLIRMMIGRTLEDEPATYEIPPRGEEALKVTALSSPRKFHNVNLSVRKGEILGVAGLVGAGRTELLEAIFGLDPVVKGAVEVDGKPFVPSSPTHSLQSGLGLVPEDRKRHGLILSLTSKENVSLPSLDQLSRASWLDFEAERKLVGKYFDVLRVKAPSQDTLAGGLSGGNQQKLVLAKWLAANCEVLLIDEPTRGVDVGAKSEIHALIRNFAAQGKAVLVVSSDLPELISLAHRLLVMREGQIVGELEAGPSEESVMRLMAGVAAPVSSRG